MVDIASVPTFPVVDEWSPGVHMLQNGWRPTGGPVNPGADEGLLNLPLQELANRTVNLKTRVDKLVTTAGSLVTVGPGGNYATINAALAALSQMRPAYVPGGFNTELRLLNGYTMAEQVLVNAVNLGWISITSEAVQVPIDRAYLTTNFAGAYPAFGASYGGFLPAIATQFLMMSTGASAGRHGLFLYSGGGARVEANGCGVRSAGGCGMLLQTGSICDANGSDFRGAGDHGAQVMGGSRLAVEGGNLSGAAQACLMVTNGSNAHALGTNCSGGGAQGVQATRGGIVNARGANARRGASDAATDISVLEGGIIVAVGGTGGTSQAVQTPTANGIIFK